MRSRLTQWSGITICVGIIAIFASERPQAKPQPPPPWLKCVQAHQTKGLERHYSPPSPTIQTTRSSAFTTDDFSKILTRKRWERDISCSKGNQPSTSASNSSKLASLAQNGRRKEAKLFEIPHRSFPDHPKPQNPASKVRSKLKEGAGGTISGLNHLHG